MSNPLVTINLVVRNGEKYIRHCLDSIKSQTYGNLEIMIWDNASTDSTREIIRSEYPELRLIENEKNLGMWPGHEHAWKYSNGEYVLAVSVDIILDPKFVEESVVIFERDPKISAIQAKIYQYDLRELTSRSGGEVFFRVLARKNTSRSESEIIDTLGFEIFRSRRLINIGHGEEDKGQFDPRDSGEKEIFGVEGAVPIFRREAIENCRIMGEFVDHSYFWYGDDFDFAWRMNLFGWKQVYSPEVIAYHDRQTTKSLRRSWWDFIKTRKKIPPMKRRLDYRNVMLTIVKNDYLSNLIKDFHKILLRQLQLWMYFIIFEPFMLLEIPTIVKLLPNMLKKRKEIMKKAVLSPAEIRIWFR